MRRMTRLTRRPRRGAPAALGTGRGAWTVASRSEPTAAGAAAAERDGTGFVRAEGSPVDGESARAVLERAVVGDPTSGPEPEGPSGLGPRRSGGFGPPVLAAFVLRSPGLASADFFAVGFFSADLSVRFLDEAVLDSSSGVSVRTPAPGRGGRFGPALAGPPSPRPDSAAARGSAAFTTSGPASPEGLDTSGSVRDRGLPPRFVTRLCDDLAGQPVESMGSHWALAVARTPRRSTVTCTSPPSST